MQQQSPTPVPPPGRSAWSRRAVLTGSLVASGLTLAACSTGGTTPGASGSATKTSRGGSIEPTVPAADLTAFPASLSKAANIFAGAAASSLTGTTSAFAGWAAGARDLCAVQAAVVNQPDALSGAHVSVEKTTPTTFKSVTEAKAAIASHQAEVVKQVQAAFAPAGNDDKALLLAALVTTASALATPGPKPVAASKLPGHTTLGSRTDALQVLLARIDAAIQAIQRGLGKVSSSTELSKTGYVQLNELLLLRDQTAALIAQGHQVPSAGPVAYALPGPMTTPDQIRSVWGQTEAGIASGWVLVAASSSDKDRQDATAKALAQVQRAAALGVGVSYWPGWA